MRRREFIAALGSAAAWPVVAHMQEPGRVRRIGVLMGTPENDAEGASRIAAFRQGLRALNWTEGNNISLQIRWGAADAERIQTFATELERRCLPSSKLPPLLNYIRPRWTNAPT